ncbi:MAG: hypothetical protein WC907_04135 [Acholeplasmataceae bacterium]|jgi:hypothetical protein
MWIHVKTKMVAEVVEERVLYVSDNRVDAWKKKFEQMTPVEQRDEAVKFTRNVKSLSVGKVVDIEEISVRDHKRGDSI